MTDERLRCLSCRMPVADPERGCPWCWEEPLLPPEERWSTPRPGLVKQSDVRAKAHRSYRDIPVPRAGDAVSFSFDGLFAKDIQ
jgi:hypothetical protein